MVLDGHDGTKACDFAQKHLPSVLLSSELDGGMEVVGRAMRNAFLSTEREFFLGIDPHITRKITLQIEIQVRHMNCDALTSIPPLPTPPVSLPTSSHLFPPLPPLPYPPLPYPSPLLPYPPNSAKARRSV